MNEDEGIYEGSSIEGLSRKEEIEKKQIEALGYLQSESFQGKFVEAQMKKDAANQAFDLMKQNPETRTDDAYDNAKEKSLEATLELARLQGEFAQTMLTISGGLDLANFSGPEELQAWDKSVREILFDPNNPDSLASKTGHNIEGSLTGSISVLTFMDLWQEMYPEAADVEIAIADPELDVKSKIDIVIKTKDRVFLVQLKATRNDSVNLQVVNRPGWYGRVSPMDSNKMLAERYRRRMIEAEKPEEERRKVEVLVVEVPGINAKCVGNVFGAIRDDNKRQELANQMRDQATRLQLVPSEEAVAA